MGSLSIWHWLVLFAAVGFVSFVIMSATRASRDELSKSLVGVRGWLLFFCVTLAAGAVRLVFEPITERQKLLAEFPQAATSQAFSEYMIYWNVIAWAGAVPLLYAVWSLSSRRVPSTVAVVKYVLWGTGIGVPILIGLLLAKYAQGVAIADVVVPAILGGVVYAGIWTAYLSRSVRVARTYGLPLLREQRVSHAAASPLADTQVVTQTAPQPVTSTLSVRLATAIWWLFAVIGGVLAAIGLYEAVSTSSTDSLVAVGVGAAIYLFGGGLSYIIAGTFWKPANRRRSE